MKKLIDIDETTLTRLKIISAFEKISVKGLIEKAVEQFVSNKVENKEDEMLLFLMEQTKNEEEATEEEFFEALKG